MKRRHSASNTILPQLPEISSSTSEIRTSLASSGELVALFDDLLAEATKDPAQPKQTGFFWNRSAIAKAYKEDRLYVISDWRLDLPELRSHFEAHGAKFASCSSEWTWPFWTVPAFAVVEADHPRTIDMIWVREDWRGFGYARALVNLLAGERACSLPDSIAFWTHLGFRPTGEKRGANVWMKRIEAC